MLLVRQLYTSIHHEIKTLIKGTPSIHSPLRGRSLFISWGGGWAILGGGHEKNSTPNGGGQNFIYESMGRGSQIWFPFPFLASKCSSFWRAKLPDTLSYHFFFQLSCPTFHHHTQKMKTRRDTHILRCPQSDSFVAVHTVICKYRHFIRCILFQTSVIRKVNLQHPHPTRNVIVPCQEIESYRYIMFKNLSYHMHLYCTLCLFL